MSDEAPRRAIGLTSHDQVMGQMIERTDQLIRQAEDQRRTQESLTQTLQGVQVVLTKLDVTVTNLSQQVSNYHDMEARLRKTEERLITMQAQVFEAVEFKKLVMKWGVIVAIAAIGGSTTLGPLVEKHIHLF